ncbi:MAG: queuosine precursor transporter [Planctomycetota bacterium]
MTTGTSDAERDLDFPFLVLTGLFLAALVSCNLIANKFVSIDLGFKTFTVSAGILPYPVTFLATDILSEMYGKRRANQVVGAGFFASVFVLLVLWLGNQFPAIPGSPVSDETYRAAFQNAWRVMAASMVAYLVAQHVDVWLYHFWKDLTRGRHLWLRNNGSTILSQLLDTVLVVSVLFAGQKTASEIGGLIADGWFFKVICALCDTPFIYLAVALFRRRAVA